MVQVDCELLKIRYSSCVLSSGSLHCEVNEGQRKESKNEGEKPNTPYFLNESIPPNCPDDIYMKCLANFLRQLLNPVIAEIF